MIKEDRQFKNYYMAIFSTNYLFQGVVQSVFAVIVPIYMLQLIPNLEVTVLTFLGTIIFLPWVLKVFYGILGDKVGSKRFGRRRIWIIGMFSFAGLIFIILGTPGFLTPQNAINAFVFAGLLIFFGVSFADTITDGLILDIVPKEKLGRTSGLTWGLRSVGAIAGGPIFAVLVVFGGFSIPLVFIIVGIFMILSSLLVILINEPKEYPEVKLVLHLKQMLNNKRDLKTYFFSLFAAILDGVVVLLVSIFLLIQLNLIQTDGITLSLTTTDPQIYLYQAYLNLIISIGIVIGSIVGGQMSDKTSRKISVYFAYIITTVALLLMIIPTFWFILLFFASLVGLSIGWRHSSYSAIATQISKQHPEMDSTYYSLCNAFANLGTTLGLSLTGMVLDLTASFRIAFIFLAIISNIGLIVLFVMKPKDYELSKNLSSSTDSEK
jgi:PAT family beta-lactamase induction signal transducer AmpG